MSLSPRARRRLFAAALLLALGAATTLSVAWVLGAARYPARAEGGPFRYDTQSFTRERNWEVMVRSGPGKWMALLTPRSKHDDEVLPEFDASGFPAWARSLPPPASKEDFIQHDARGWPFLSFRCSWRRPATQYYGKGEAVRGGLQARGFDPEWSYEIPPLFPGGGLIYVPPRDTELRALPFTPIWSGALLSTVFWAAAWAVPLAIASLPATLRRRRRARHGLCAACAYDLRAIPGSACCPECGRDRRLPPPWLRLSTRAGAAALLLLLASLAAFAYWQHTLMPAPHAIHLAARDGDVRRLKTLLARGVDPNLPADCPSVLPGRGEPPIVWAAVHGQVDSITVLLGARPRPDPEHLAAALRSAVEHNHPAAVRVLVEAMRQRGLDPTVKSRDGHSPLVAAAGNNDPACLQLLLELGFDANGAPGEMPLAAAALRGRIDNLRILIDAGADLAAQSFMTYYMAAIAGQPETVRFLIDAGMPVPSSPRILSAATSGNHEEIALLLLAHCANPAEAVAADPNWGETPLRAAVSVANLRLLQLCIAHGADPHESSPRHPSLLYDVGWSWATPEFLDYLFSLGIGPNQATLDGRTPLMNAALRGSLTGVERLLAAGADPNARDHAGLRALEYALARSGVSDPTTPEHEIVRLLRAAMTPTSESDPP